MSVYMLQDDEMWTAAACLVIWLYFCEQDNFLWRPLFCEVNTNILFGLSIVRCFASKQNIVHLSNVNCDEHVVVYPQT